MTDTIFILTTVADREIVNDIFPSMEAAKEQMREEYFAALADDGVEFDETNPDTYNSPCNYELEEETAYANDMGLNHAGIDWAITEHHLPPEFFKT